MKFPQHLRKELPEPRAAREHVDVGRELRAVGERDAAESPSLDRRRRRGELPVFAAFRLESLEDRRAGETRRQVAGVLLGDRPRDPLEVDLRIPLCHLGERELLEGDAALPQERQRRLLVRIVLAHHPEGAGAVIETPAPALLVLAPELEGPGDHADVDAVGPVGGPDHPRLAARAGARVAGAPGVEQRDLRAAPQQEERRPAAEGSGADDDDPRGRARPAGHGSRDRCRRQHRQERAARDSGHIRS